MLPITWSNRISLSQKSKTRSNDRFTRHDPFLYPIIILALFQLIEMLIASLTSLNLGDNWLQNLDKEENEDKLQ